MYLQILSVVTREKGFPGGASGKEPACQCRFDVGSIPGREDPLEEGMATHSSILAWEISWTEQPGGLSTWGPALAGGLLPTGPPGKSQEILFKHFFLPEYVLSSQLFEARDAFFRSVIMCFLSHCLGSEGSILCFLRYLWSLPASPHCGKVVGCRWDWGKI